MPREPRMPRARHRLRLWMAIPLALVLAFLFVWSWRERVALSERMATLGAITPDPAAALDAQVASADAGAAHAVALGADGGAQATPAELHPVRLSAPTVVRAGESAGAGVLRGRVLAFASARPVPGAEVSFARDGVTQSVRTNANGELTFAPDEPGAYVLALVTADGFLPFAPEWGHSPVRFVARRGVRLEGVVVYLVDALGYVVRVLDAQERPVAGAAVRIFGMERGERTLAPMAARFVTDGEGEAQFVAPDGVVLEAEHPSHGRGRARLDTAAQVSHRVIIRLAREGTPPGDRRIAGRVLGAGGEPLEGALIVARHSARRSSAQADIHPLLEATSGAEGRFTLEDADEGTYHLVVTAPEHARLLRDHVASGAEDLVLRLAREGRLRVLVREGVGGAPVAAATVIVTRETGPLTQETLAIESSYDAEGEIEIGGLPPGPCAAVAIAPGYAQSSPVHAIVREGGAPSTVQIDLGRGGSIRGTVVSRAGSRPLAGARATLEGMLGSGASTVPLEASTLTDGSGRFTLEGVTAGTRSVAIWAADHHGRLRSGIAIQDGETIDLGTVDLTPIEEGERPSLELAGIGVVLSAEGDAMVVGRVIEGGGASEAGLVAGDAILDVSGTPVVDLGFDGTIQRIRGPEGTTVGLRVRRADGSIELLAVPRRRIRA